MFEDKAAKGDESGNKAQCPLCGREVFIRHGHGEHGEIKYKGDAVNGADDGDGFWYPHHVF